MAKGVVVQDSDNVRASHRNAIVGHKGEAVAPIIYNTWQATTPCHVLLKGEGGMGKTVQLFNIALSDEVQNRGCLVIYMPALDVNLSLNAPIDSYVEEFVGDSEKERMMALFRRAAKKSWSKGPKVIVLLDGFNEIDPPSRGVLAQQLSKWLSGKPGVQVIVSSRAEMSGAIHRIGNTVEIELQPLDDEVIDSFLMKNQVPMINDKDRAVINSPLMLMLYTKLILFDKVESGSDVFLYRDELNPGKLLIDYLRIEEFNTDTKSTQCLDKKKYYASIVLCEYIAPRVSFSMTEGYKFQLEDKEFRKLVREAFAQFEEAFYNNTLPMELNTVQQMSSEFALKEADIIAANESLCLFETKTRTKVAGGPFYQLVHQNFRDCLAAMYVCERIKFAQLMGSEPTVLDKSIGAYVLPYVADIVDSSLLEFIWSKCRRKWKIIPPRADNLFRITGERGKNEHARLDWSKIDFRDYDLFKFVTEEGRVIFPARKCCSVNARFSLRTIGVNKHPDHISRAYVDSVSGKCVIVKNHKEICIWDFIKGTAEHCINVGRTNVVYITISMDSKALIGFLDNGEVIVWDLFSGKEKGKAQLERKWVESAETMNVVQGPFGELRIGILEHNRVQVWNLQSNRCECDFSGGIKREKRSFAVLSFSGKYYLCETRLGVFVLHTDKDAIHQLPQTDGTNWVYFWFDSHNEEYCYGVTNHGMIRKWNLESNIVISTEWLQDYTNHTQPGFHEYLPNESPWFRNKVFLTIISREVTLKEYVLKDYRDFFEQYVKDSNDEKISGEENNKNVLAPGESIYTRCFANDFTDSLSVRIESNNQIAIAKQDSGIPEYYVGIPERPIMFAKADVKGETCVVIVDKDILVWDLNKQICKCILNNKVNVSENVIVEMTPDGSKLIILTNTTILNIYDLNFGGPVRTVKCMTCEKIGYVRFDCSNRFCAILFGFVLQIWELSSFRCVKKVELSITEHGTSQEKYVVDITVVGEEYCSVLVSDGCVYRVDIEQPDGKYILTNQQLESSPILGFFGSDGSLFAASAYLIEAIATDEKEDQAYDVKSLSKYTRVLDAFFDSNESFICVYEDGRIVRCLLNKRRTKRRYVRKGHFWERLIFSAYCPIRYQRISQIRSSCYGKAWSVTIRKGRYIEVISGIDRKQITKKFTVFNEAYVKGLDMSMIRFCNRKTEKKFCQNGAKTR